MQLTTKCTPDKIYEIDRKTSIITEILKMPPSSQSKTTKEDRNKIRRFQRQETMTTTADRMEETVQSLDAKIRSL